VHQVEQLATRRQHNLRAPVLQFQALHKYIMILNELYERSPSAYQDVAADNTQPHLGQLRKTKLTLMQLNKLRKMNDTRTFEYNEKLKDIRTQYAPPAAAPM
jgi:prephenate dehydrogenase